MLVLSGKKDEEIVIWTDDGMRLVVTVVELRGDRVRLGFTGDPTIHVDRSALYERKRQAHEKAGEAA